jgi:hypothetical protein
VSDTPETDNLARGNHVVPTEFAQDLERKCNELRRQVEDALMQRDTYFEAYSNASLLRAAK